MSDCLWTVLIITIGTCFCFSHLCKAIAVSMKAKYQYYKNGEYPYEDEEFGGEVCSENKDNG